jgi:hypothetical protein
MRKIFAALLLSVALIAGPAMAQDAATEANHAAAVEAAKSASTSTAPAPKNELVNIADGLADAVTRTASKLNVEIQDFITSPAGFVLMAGVIIKYAGHEINQWIGALTWLFVFGGLWLWWARKTFGVYNEKGKFVSFKWYNPASNGDIPGGAILAFISALVIMIVFALQLP